MFLSTDALLECVPNFSEGSDALVLNAIKNAITSVYGVSLLHVDSNISANRTVFTFIGLPNSVCEAAFNAIKVASELIDMSKHSGTHPRIGATDVCPLIPVANISIEETDLLVQKLAKKVGDELQIPVYCYEFSAKKEYRRRLEQIRKGQYEFLPIKQHTIGWEPDFGPKDFNKKSGATVIGARHFLIAFNVNLETKSIDIAKRIAEDIRESGRAMVNPQTGENISCEGLLKNVKAIGWYITEFDIIQVSTNITNFNETPIYKVVETIKQRAQLYKTKVVGCELVGLIPLKAVLETGLFYVEDNESFTDDELISLAIDKLQLNSVKPFDANKNILEKLIEISND